MTNPAGSFIWYELMSPDPDAAKAFYDNVVGWTIAPESPGDDMDYRMIARSDGGNAGGVLRLTDDMQAHGARPLWLAYFYTADVDAAARAIEADGGKVQMPPHALDGVGRFAMLTDPQGVPFYIMNPTPPPGMEGMASDVFSPSAVQRVSWNELASPDLAASKAFYAKHFGFEFNQVMNMGPMGDYCFIDHGGQQLGAIMQRQDERQPAVWLFYFRVPSVAAGKAAIEAAGGTVLMGPHQVPTGDWIVLATDPHGAGFGLVGPKGD
ncbi:VOC family protein [Novosphingobium lentum]|uniref:VOC family protein n=1 Tax=Novosphingobium lentum TaxID=145287 RepID=UPI00082BACCE|nr:VOC family protein [Novosphingobium lentum]